MKSTVVDDARFQLRTEVTDECSAKTFSQDIVNTSKRSQSRSRLTCFRIGTVVDLRTRRLRVS